MPGRVVAFGDIHGDIDALYRVLSKFGLIDKSRRWSGGATIAVSVGDVVDGCRNGALCEWPRVSSFEILDYLKALKRQARSAGGDVIILLGNHEMMVIQDSRRYMSARDVAYITDHGLELSRGSEDVRRVFGDHIACFEQDGVVYVHAGLTKTVTSRLSIAQFNNAVLQHFIDGVAEDELASKYRLGMGEIREVLNGPFWGRHTEPRLCRIIKGILEPWGMRSMVVGHQITTSRRPEKWCRGSVYMLDIAMSAGFHVNDPVADVAVGGIEVVDGDVAIVSELIA